MNKGLILTGAAVVMYGLSLLTNQANAQIPPKPSRHQFSVDSLIAPIGTNYQVQFPNTSIILVQDTIKRILVNDTLRIGGDFDVQTRSDNDSTKGAINNEQYNLTIKGETPSHYFMHTEGGLDFIELNLTGIEGKIEQSLNLFKNKIDLSPNPARNFKINYEIPFDSNVKLTIYNLLGQEVKTLFEGNGKKGKYTTGWNGSDNSGNKVASGNYVLRLISGKYTTADIMTFVR